MSSPLSEDSDFTPRLRPLRALAEKILGCNDLAEDAVQEALIALWQTKNQPHRPQAWLAQAVVNRSLHHLRTVARRRKHECAAPATCRITQDPARHLEHSELRSRLESAIRALPSEFRQPFELYELEGLDYRQISKRTELPIGTVRSRIFRARRRLRDLLGDYEVAV